MWAFFFFSASECGRVRFWLHWVTWISTHQQESRVRIWKYLSESMSYSPQFCRASHALAGRLCLCLVCTVWGRGLSRGHCLVKLKVERWHAVSLSWRSLLNALAPPDMPYSGWEDRRVPAACRRILPFNWALTQDSFPSSPRATLGADKTVQVTTLGSLFRIRKRQRL